MRIVIAGDFPDQPPNVAGGIQSVIFNTLEGLASNPELDIHIVTCEKRGQAARNGAWQAQGRGWQAHYLPSPPRMPHSLSMLTIDRWRVARTIEDLHPDLVHAHGQVAAYPWAAFDTGRPTVVTVHGLNALEAQIDPRGRWPVGQLRAFLWAQVERACLRRATDLIIISPFVAKVVRPHTRARLHWIENPVEQRLLKLERQPVEGRILYVGSIQKRKGLADLVQAVDILRTHLPTVHLHVAGEFMPVYSDYGNHVKELVQSLYLDDRVHFLGHLDREALLNEYQTCAVFCLPSYLEASPMVVAEAMAAGCPVVTTKIDSTTHLITDGDTGYRVPPGEPQLLAESLQMILTDTNRQNALGQFARRAASNRFDPHVAANNAYQVYNTCISNAR